jgi:hypothetical protein
MEHWKDIRGLSLIRIARSPVHCFERFELRKASDSALLAAKQQRVIRLGLNGLIGRNLKTTIDGPGQWEFEG